MKFTISDLIEAVMIRDINKINLCIQGGVDVNGYEDMAKLTPLHVAVNYSNYECVDLLLKNGANPFAKTDEGETPLDFIKCYSQCEIIRLLVKAMAKKKKKELLIIKYLGIN